MQFVKATYVTRFRKFQEFRPRQIITTTCLETITAQIGPLFN